MENNKTNYYITEIRKKEFQHPPLDPKIRPNENHNNQSSNRNCQLYNHTQSFSEDVFEKSKPNNPSLQVKEEINQNCCTKEDNKTENSVCSQSENSKISNKIPFKNLDENQNSISYFHEQFSKLENDNTQHNPPM